MVCDKVWGDYLPHPVSSALCTQCQVTCKWMPVTSCSYSIPTADLLKLKSWQGMPQACCNRVADSVVGPALQGLCACMHGRCTCACAQAPPHPDCRTAQAPHHPDIARAPTHHQHTPPTHAEVEGPVHMHAGHRYLRELEGQV